MPAPLVTKYSPMRPPPVATPAHIDAVAAQARHRCAAEIVVGQPGDEADAVAEPRQPGRDVRLRARDPHVELGPLEQQLAPGRGEP